MANIVKIAWQTAILTAPERATRIFIRVAVCAIVMLASALAPTPAPAQGETPPPAPVRIIDEAYAKRLIAAAEDYRTEYQTKAEVNALTPDELRRLQPLVASILKDMPKVITAGHEPVPLKLTYFITAALGRTDYNLQANPVSRNLAGMLLMNLAYGGEPGWRFVRERMHKFGPEDLAALKGFIAEIEVTAKHDPTQRDDWREYPRIATALALGDLLDAVDDRLNALSYDAVEEGSFVEKYHRGLYPETGTTAYVFETRAGERYTALDAMRGTNLLWPDYWYKVNFTDIVRIYIRGYSFDAGASNLDKDDILTVIKLEVLPR